MKIPFTGAPPTDTTTEKLMAQEPIQVPEPKDVPEAKKMPILRVIMMVVMVLLMVGMMALMVSSGMFSGDGGGNPMRMMMPVMMVMMMGMGMMSMVGGGETANELAAIRKSYFQQLGEVRKEANKASEMLYDFQQKTFPTIAMIENSVGNADDMSRPIMWQLDEDTRGGFSDIEEFEYLDVAFVPYLSARFGTAVVRRYPDFDLPEVSVPDNVEPVTTGGMYRFIRVQRNIPQVPVGLSFDRDNMEAPGIGFSGNKDIIRANIRQQVLSAAFGHAPHTLRIAVITDKDQLDQWNWVKWLPHAEDIHSDEVVNPPMIYTSFQDFQAAHELLSEDKIRTLVIVDTPSQIAATTMIPKHYSYIVVSAEIDQLAVDLNMNYEVNNTGFVTLPKSHVEVRLDTVGLRHAEHIAKKFSPYTTPELAMLTGSAISEVSSDPGFGRRLTLLDAMGIEDIDTFDPRKMWRENTYTMNYKIPLGHVWDEKTHEYKNDDFVWLDLGEAGAGGDGPHGKGGGRSGMGKSVLLMGMVANMMSRFSPESASFIFMDFKGGATFRSFRDMPHVIANITNLNKESDMVSRAYHVIEGLLQSRQELFDKIGVADIKEYRKQHSRGKLKDYPPIPDIFIIADEYTEFIKKNDIFKKLFSSVGRVGRSLGVHMLPFTQKMETALLGELADQISFGISLSVNSPQDSREVIDSIEATTLKEAGEAYLFTRSRQETQRFRAFNSDEKYVPPVRTNRTTVTVSEDDDFEYDNKVIYPFPDLTTGDEIIEHDDLDILGVLDDAPEEEPDDDAPTIIDVFVDKLKEFNEIKAPALWTTPLKIPFTYATSSIEAHANSSLNSVSVDFGEVDAPQHHTRWKAQKELKGPWANFGILGGPQSGKTAGLTSIISSLSLSYLPTQVQFLGIDYTSGGKLNRVREYPQVIGVTSGSRKENVKRYMGEIRKILDIREQFFAEWECESLDEYFRIRDEKNLQYLDPFGHLFLVIDGLDNAHNEDKKNERPDFTLGLVDSIVRTSGAVGIHAIFTMTTIGQAYKVQGLPMNWLIMGGAPANDVTGINQISNFSPDAKAEVKKLASSVPSDQPGRFFDPEIGLHGRFRYPILEHYEPDRKDKDGLDVFEYRDQYSDNIVATANMLKSNLDPSTFPEEIKVAGTSVDLKKDVLDPYWGSRKKDTRDIDIPYGLMVDDLDYAIIPARYSAAVIGGKSSGKTTALRGMVNSTAMQLPLSDDAMFIIVDGSGDWFDVQDELKRQGRLISYVTTKPEAKETFDRLGKIILSRMPDVDNLTREQIKNRTWYSDQPDVYVVMDGFERFTSGYDAESVNLAAALNDTGRQDLGVRFFLAENDTNIMGYDTNSLIKALRGMGLETILMSAARTVNVDGLRGEKFPAGRAKVSGPEGPIEVQIGDSPEW